MTYCHQTLKGSPNHANKGHEVSHPTFSSALPRICDSRRHHCAGWTRMPVSEAGQFLRGVTPPLAQSSGEMIFLGVSEFFASSASSASIWASNASDGVSGIFSGSCFSLLMVQE